MSTALTERETTMPLPMQPIADPELAALIRLGRTQLTLTVSPDVAASVDTGRSFWTYGEKPLTSSNLRDAVVAHVAARIKRGELDAADGPVLTTATVYRMAGRLFKVRPDRQSAKGLTVETLPALVVTEKARYLAAFDAAVREYVDVKPPREWTQAETDRASKPVKTVDAKAVPVPAVSDQKWSVYTIEPQLAGPLPTFETANAPAE